MIFPIKIIMGHNSINSEGVVVLYHIVWSCFIFVPSFEKISHRISELLSRILKFTKGNIPSKKVHRVTVYALCISSDN